MFAYDQVVEWSINIHSYPGELGLPTKSEGRGGKEGTVQLEVGRGWWVWSGGSPWNLETLARHKYKITYKKSISGILKILF